MSILVWIAVFALAVVALWVTGRAWTIQQISAQAAASEAVIKYHNDLVRYADSHGSDSEAMNALLLNSTKVERFLGADNWIVGSKVVKNYFNGVPAVPYAIRAIHESIADPLWQGEAYQAVELVRNILVRHVGRRNDEAEELTTASKNAFRCIALGWKLWAAIPLYLLSGFGLIKWGTVKRARNSLLFAIYSSILFVAAVAGPLFAYITDRAEINAALNGITH
jgi:hypothetical protein